MRSPLRLTLPLIMHCPDGAVVALANFGPRAGDTATGLTLGTGLAADHICSKRASNARAAAGSWMMMMSLSCCLSPDAVRLAEPERKTRPSMEYDFKCM